MRDRFREFEQRGARVLVVTTATHIPDRGGHVILKDQAFTVSAIYGVAFQWPDDTLGSSRPATFVIDRTGVIRFVHRAGSKPGHVFFSEKPTEDAHWSYDRPSTDELFAVIDGLDKRAGPPAPTDRVLQLRRAGVAALIEALKDEDSSVRAEAASILGGMGSKAKAAVPALAAALNDKVGYVRSEAARALGRVGSEAKAAVPALAAAVRDRDEGVRRAAADALAAIGPDAKGAVRALLQASGDQNGIVLESVSEALRRIGVVAVAELAAALKDDAVHVRLGAARGLAQIGPGAKAAVPALAEALKDSNAHVRAASAEALGKIGPEATAAVPALRKALKDSYGGARTQVITALGRIDPAAEGLVAALVEAMKDEESRVRHAAVGTLGLVGPDRRVVAALTAALRDSDDWVRLAAAMSLNRIRPGTREVVPVLVELVRNEDGEIRTAASAALKSIDPEAWKKLERERKQPPEILSNSIGMKLALIPAGEFLMGAPASDPDAEEHEKPQHKVRITKPFYVGVHEVTVGQFRKFVQDTGHQTGAETDGKGSSGYNAELRGFEYGKKGYTWKNVGWEQSDDHPVLNLTWDDAMAFCRWLSKKENKRYRLPTEAEWEYACRAGTATRFFSGDALEDTRKVANVLDQSLIEKWEAAARDLKLNKPHKYNIPMKWDDGYPFTAPVGRFRANLFGLHDTHGNAAEWCADWYDKDYYRNSPAVDPTGPPKGTTRVVRGGTFLSSPKVSRASMRVASFPDYHNYVIGFRVVLEKGASDPKEYQSNATRPDQSPRQSAAPP